MKLDGTELNGMEWNSKHDVITACHAMVLLADIQCTCSTSVLYAAGAAALCRRLGVVALERKAAGSCRDCGEKCSESRVICDSV